MTIRKRKTLPQVSEDTLFDTGINSDENLGFSQSDVQADDPSLSPANEIQAAVEQTRIEQNNEADDEVLEKKVVVRSRGRKKNRKLFG